jgi:hypothetical protein
VLPSAQRQEAVAEPSVLLRVAAVVQPSEPQPVASQSWVLSPGVQPSVLLAVAAQPWGLRPEERPWAQQVASAQPSAAQMELSEAERPSAAQVERPWVAEAAEPSVGREERLLELQAEPGERLAAVPSVQPAAGLSEAPSVLPSFGQAALPAQRWSAACRRTPGPATMR